MSVSVYARRVAGIAVTTCVAATLSLTACSSDNDEQGPGETRTLDAAIVSSVDEAVANAMQLSVSTQALVSVSTSAGEYLRGYGDSLQPNAPIRAAQAAQPVLCALLLELVKEGTVSLTRKVSEDLPRQLGIDDITYGQLCVATSGLADFKTATLVDIFANNPSRPWAEQELLTQALAHSPLAEPGTEQHVSDSDALLLAQALSQASKQPIESLLDDYIFTPAEMTGSYYPSNIQLADELPSGGLIGSRFLSSGGVAVCTVPGEAEGESVAVEPTPVPQLSPSMLGAAGATVTTVTDLTRFYAHYLAGEFGENSAELISVPSAPQSPEQAAAEAAGEAEAAPPAADGWTFGLEKQGPLYGMSGAITGTITAAYRAPEHDVTVVVSLGNSSAGAAFVRALAFQLATIVGVETPWSAEDQAAALAERAVCQPAAE